MNRQFVSVYILLSLLVFLYPQAKADDDRRRAEWESAYHDHTWKLDQKDGPSWMVRLQKDGSAIVRSMSTQVDSRGRWRENSWGNLTLEDSAEGNLSSVTLNFEMNCKSLSWVDAKSGSWGYGNPDDYAFPSPGSLAKAEASNGPGLLQALVSSTWWVKIESKFPEYQNEVRFFPNGTAQFGPPGDGVIWNWTATGPRSFTLDGKGARLQGQTQDLRAFTFNDAFTYFSGDWPGKTVPHYLSGSRMGPVAGVPNTSQTTPPEPMPGAVPWIGVFAGEWSKAAEWTGLPLRMSIPPSIREGLVAIDTGLKIESSKSPQASLEAYVSADKICRIIVFALDDREAKLKQNQLDNQGHLTDQWESQWGARSTRYHATIETEYVRFVEAVNRSVRPKLPPAVTALAAVSIPPAPKFTQAEQSAAKPNQTPYVNPLDRGAYDQHPIWTPWWGTAYYRR